VRDLDVLVVGDANPDLVLRGDVVPRFGQAEQLLDAADLVLAGSAGIVAAGTARLGLRTALVAHVGRDLFGQLVVSALAERGVDVTGLHVEDDVPTGLSVVLSAPDDRAILTRLGALTRLDPDAVGDDLLARARHVHVASWFLLPGLASRGAGLLARARAAGCTTSLDTNWDPARRWAGVREALAVTDVLLPNEAELVALAGALEDDARAPAGPDAAAHRLQAARHRLVAHAVAAGTRLATEVDVVDEQHDAEDGHDERGQDGQDQLLGGLDRAFVVGLVGGVLPLVVRVAHGILGGPVLGVGLQCPEGQKTAGL